MYKNVERAKLSKAALNKAVAALDIKIQSSEYSYLWSAYRSIQQHVSFNRQVSINVHAPEVLKILDSGTFKNIHQLVDEDPELSRGYHQNLIYQRRLIAAIVGFREVEEQLIYGCLNSGNDGLTLFGPFCFILSNEFVRPRVSFTRHNSYLFADTNYLHTHDRVSDKFNPDLDLATWDTVPKLAALKFGEQLLQNPFLVNRELLSPKAINGLIAGYSDCIEAQIHGPVILDHVTEVRVPVDFVVRRLQLRDKKQRGVKLHTVEEGWEAEHEPIFEKLEELGFLVIPV